MSSYQKITLVGRLGSNPQMKYLDDGRAVTEFSLAVNEYSRPAKGKKRGSKTTTWFKITCWERLAETAAEHLSKGRQVLVEGKVKNPRPWSDRNGEPRCNLDVVAFDVRFLDGKNDDSFEDGYEEDTDTDTSVTKTASFQDPTYEKVPSSTYEEDDLGIEDVEIIPWQ